MLATGLLRSEEHAGAIRREVEDLQEHFRKEREELEAKIEAANMSAREAHEHKADIMGRSKADQEELKSMKKKLEQEIVRREKDAAVHKEELKRLMIKIFDLFYLMTDIIFDNQVSS